MSTKLINNIKTVSRPRNCLWNEKLTCELTCVIIRVYSLCEECAKCEVRYRKITIPNITVRERKSRKYRDSEWMLSPKIFDNVIKQLDYTPTIDLFPSRINAQVQPYVSFRPDPFAKYVDAFTLNWDKFEKPYIYVPPFLYNKPFIYALQDYEIMKETVSLYNSRSSDTD